MVEKPENNIPEEKTEPSAPKNKDPEVEKESDPIRHKVITRRKIAMDSSRDPRKPNK